MEKEQELLNWIFDISSSSLTPEEIEEGEREKEKKDDMKCENCQKERGVFWTSLEKKQIVLCLKCYQILKRG